MRNPVPLIATLLFFSFPALSQNDSAYTLFLRTGSVNPPKNISANFIQQFNQRSFRIDGQAFAVLQFERLPTIAEREQLGNAGIVLMDYLPVNSFTVSIKGNINEELLGRMNVRAIVELNAQQKMSVPLSRNAIPSWAVKIPGTVDVWISFPKTLPYEAVAQELRNRNFDILPSPYKDFQILALRISQQRITELAALNFVGYVQPAPPEDKELNFNSEAGSRANVLNASVANGGFNLHGEGIVIGVGDNADPLQHIDISSHVINRNATNGGAHGLHVMGTAAGAGIMEEKFSGYASKSTILSQLFSGIWTNASAYVQDHGMVITNNSYGAIEGDCSYNGVYDLYSRMLDQQAFNLPSLQNVFAAGNSGASTCSPYPAGFKTVLGSYQSAKNIIDVGNTTYDGTIITASSKGPVQDGRIKPEISLMGTAVLSCWSGNNYLYNTGTSMSAPGASGGLALLYQRYRQLNGGSNPKNALMKALLVNGATDRGNAGPDFSYGFGWMNLVRSIDMLNNNHYFNSSIATAGLNNHTISIPPNTAQLKVLLYWNDPAASVLSSHTLVNDLDLEVVTPSAATVFPSVLDTLPANLNSVATTGIDHINNIEQVTITNPAAGNYSVNVKGFAVPQNSPQEYFLVYDAIPVSTVLTNPTGGEAELAADSIFVEWDSYGDPANPFTIQFSFDGGATWINDSSAAANARLILWRIPNIATDQAMVRITRNGTPYTSTSHPFTIIGRPTVTLAPVQCEGYITINWTPVTGATDYEVMMERGGEMVSIATTTTAVTSYTFSNLSKDSIYYVTVRARLNGNPGMKATAVARQPSDGNCSASTYDGDLKLDSIVAPLSGRSLTSTALTASTVVQARIHVLDDAAATSFDMKFFVNGTLIASEPVSTTVSALGFYTYSFATTYDFSAPGTYLLTAVVVNTALTDPNHGNDTMTVVIRQLNNSPITLSVGSDFLDDLEPATDSSYYKKKIGFDGADRYDFVSSSSYGRIRTFINTGIAYSGRNALTLDVDRFTAGGVTDSLTGTFNLATHNAVTEEIRLDFRYKNHGEVSNAANKVWIRGDDQKPWVEVYDLFANQNDPGLFKKTNSIEISDVLTGVSQNFSSSFQVRWGEWGQRLTADNENAAGYTFDDIHLYKVADDVQMISIDAPIAASCGLTAATQIKVTVRNSMGTTINNIPVMYRIDGGVWISETIPFINANSATQYIFTTTANLSSFGSHLLETKVQLATDSYNENDTTSIRIVNSPVISSFPYLENFETGNGSWYTGGQLSTWEYGTPASLKIRSAASGSKAWKTSLVGNYNDNEFSYLYSPCFDISAMTTPTVSFSVALDIEDCGPSQCDAAWVEYSADGKTWTRLGSAGTGTNWYNRNYGTGAVWSVQGYTRWHVATAALPTGLSNLRLRFVMRADPGVNLEGIAVDDIHIYDNVYGIYTGATLGSPVNQNVSGNNWVDFTSGGKLVASVHPNNQNLGSTDVQVYINTGAVRYTGGQYYHDRNITIKPTNYGLVDSATVRFYFLDTETEALINATACPYCTKPSSAYELGVSKYTDVALRTNENGTLADDAVGIWSFINSPSTIKVPFDKGYYAEFKVKDFSEFWLNNGWLTGSVPLPVKLISFTAHKQASNDVLLQWKTAEEIDINRYEIEVARTNRDYQANSFVKIGQAVAVSQGNSSSQHDYSFIDNENNKSGVRYYRLKIIENDGSFRYSVIRPVVFNNAITWQVYPNPSKGFFNFIFQQNDGEIMNLKVYDVNGRMIKELSVAASGFEQKIAIDLSSTVYAKGIYVIRASGVKDEMFKLIKE